ncbi:MAG: hypothetical protein SFY68_14930 [Candidatus Sumerlaeia bacterium]|nr:hypothetical protein [Candidatus Sumerlaeia bacterium]
MMNRPSFPIRRRRATTLVEMLFTVALFSLMGTFLITITLEVAQRFRQSITQVPALEQNIRSLTFVRNQLLPADWTSLVISNDGGTIQFVNPNEGTTSELRFNGETNRLEYQPDIASDSLQTWGRNVTGTFARTADNRSIIVTLRSSAMGRNNTPLEYSFTETIKVRN